MKFMRLGTRPDTFYTEEATRTILSDSPSDLTICVNSVTYHLHMFQLVPKCGLLQQLCSDEGDSSCVTVELHDIPGGEDAFELCAKFCYGITIDLSAYNFVPAICAAKFLQMSESFEKGNFVTKLEAFFHTCILEGWKDSIVTLQATERFPKWSEKLGIIRRCIDSVVEKILTSPAKVRWSYTYTRPGYAQKKHHHSAPKDWWTEDVADLNIDQFRCVINTVRSTNILPPQLIGEALHVYACRWLSDVTRSTPQPETSTASHLTEEEYVNKRRQLETIVSMIPEDKGSVSVGFLLRLLSIAHLLGASPVINTQLIKQCGLQLEEATLNDLMLPSHDSSGEHHMYDIELVTAVLESYIMQWRKSYSRDHHSVDLIRKVGELIDSYLQVVARDAYISVDQVVSLAKALPDFARLQHDNLYKAVNIYLKEHPQMSKEEKKQLCSVLDCQKLSPPVCAHVVKNERLPLRTVVQVLFFEHEKCSSKATASHDFRQSEIQHNDKPPTQITEDRMKGLQLGAGEQSSKAEGARQRSAPPSRMRQRLEQESEQKSRRKKILDMGSDKARGIVEEISKLDPTKRRIQRSKSEHGHNKSK